MKRPKTIPLAYLILPLTAFLHALWATLFWYQLRLAEDSIDGKDSIQYAQQLGRLDLISLILASFGIILAIIAIGWFNYVRTEAKNEAREEIRECGALIIHKYLEDNPNVILEAVHNAKAVSQIFDKMKEEMQAEIANNIAESMSNSDNDK